MRDALKLDEKDKEILSISFINDHELIFCQGRTSINFHKIEETDCMSVSIQRDWNWTDMDAIIIEEPDAIHYYLSKEQLEILTKWINY